MYYSFLNNSFILHNIKSLVRHFSNGKSDALQDIGNQITVSRTVTKEDVDSFSVLSKDTNTIHASDEQKQAVVHGAFLNSIVSAVMGTKLPGPGCLVVQQTLNFPNKCYVGETVDVTVKLIENRKILKVDFSCDVKDKNKKVLFGSAKLVMSK